MSDEESGFKFYSIGIVAENKALGSKQIKVTPIERLPMLDGEIRSNPTTMETSGVDGYGVAYQSSAVSDNVLPAIWRGETNRRTAPDVRRGERVEIYQQANSGKYYWKSCGDDDRLRKLETAVYSWSDTPSEADDSTAPGKCYFFEVSTHQKTVTFETAQANGEPYLHTIQINAAEGIVTIKDDVGNYVEINSPETRITLQNALGTYVVLDKEHLRSYAPQTVHCEAGTLMTHKVGSVEWIFTPGTAVLNTPSLDINQS